MDLNVFKDEACLENSCPKQRITSEDNIAETSSMGSTCNSAGDKQEKSYTFPRWMQREVGKGRFAKLEDKGEQQWFSLLPMETLVANAAMGKPRQDGSAE